MIFNLVFLSLDFELQDLWNWLDGLVLIVWYLERFLGAKKGSIVSRVFFRKIQSGLRSATTEILISHTLQGNNISHQPGKGK